MNVRCTPYHFSQMTFITMAPTRATCPSLPQKAGKLSSQQHRLVELLEKAEEKKTLKIPVIHHTRQENEMASS